MLTSEIMSNNQIFKEILLSNSVKSLPFLFYRNKSIEQLYYYLQVCRDNEEELEEEFLETLLKLYLDEEDPVDITIVMAKLIETTYIPVELVRWVYNRFDIFSFQQIMEAVIDKADAVFKRTKQVCAPKPWIPFCERLIYVSGEDEEDIDWEKWRFAIYGLEYTIPEADEYLDFKVSKYGKAASIPDWCQIGVPLEDYEPEPVPSKQEIENKIDTFTKVSNISPEILEFAFRHETNPESRLIDQSFGISNTIWDVECVSFKGKCRMLTCECYCGTEMEDWFEGKCDYCCHPIKQKEFALRYPLKGGGFSSECFCSEEHMMEYIKDKHSELKSDFSIEELRLKIFMNALRQTKILYQPCTDIDTHQNQ